MVEEVEEVSNLFCVQANQTLWRLLSPVPVSNRPGVRMWEVSLIPERIAGVRQSIRVVDVAMVSGFGPARG